MEFTTFVRKPFTVEAVEVTVDNIEEIAELIGDLREKNGKQYIAVDRRVIPNLYSVHLGYWFTKIGDNKYRCYVKRVFNQQFIENTEDIQQWVTYLNEDHITEVEKELEEIPDDGDVADSLTSVDEAEAIDVG